MTPRSFSSRLRVLPWPIAGLTTLLAAVAAHGIGSWFIITFRGEPLYVVWPGVGIGLVALYVFGRRVWPWFFAGSVLVQWIATGTVGFYTVLFPVVDTVEAWLAATLLWRGRVDPAFGRMNDVGQYVLRAAVVPTLVGAVGGLTAAGLLWGDPYYHAPITWMHWWLADVQGMLHTASVLLVWTHRPAPGSQRWPSSAWAPLLAAVVATCAIVGRTPASAPFAPALYLLPVALVIGAAIGFGARGALTTSLLTTVTLVLTLPYRPFEAGVAVNLYAGIEIASLGLLLIALAIAALMTEVTDSAAVREQMAAQLAETERLDALGRVAAGVAHDFNNLLTAILGNAALLRLRVTDTRSLQLLREVEDTSQRAAELCRQMLTVGGIDRRSPVRVDLTELVEDLGRVLRSATRRDIDLRFDLDPALPAIEADPTQVRQVLMNLVTNAAEACPDTPGHVVTVRTAGATLADDDPLLSSATPALASGRYVVLSVGDTGAGMPEDTVGRIFDPFFTTKFAGRGLGLAVVHGIVRGHRAGIVVDSAPGEGTTVSVYWRCASPEARVATVRAPAASLAGRHVLLLTPDPAAHAQARRVVSALGGRGTFATSVADAVGTRQGTVRSSVDVLVVDPDALSAPDELGALRQRLAATRCVVTVRDASAIDHWPLADREAVTLLERPYGPRNFAVAAGVCATEGTTP